MAAIIRSKISRRDYEEIWQYVAQDNSFAADQLIQEFEHRLALLVRMPQMGRLEEDLAPRLRSVSVGSYLLYYIPIENGIQLVRVLHGARDIDPEFFKK
jgi:toxin ParE1/3/4